MTTRGEINSNFYQIVNVDSNGNPTDVKPEYLPNVGNANYAANAGHANVADTANSVAVANVVGIGNIATLNLDGSASNVLYGNGVFAPGGGGGNSANANYANFAGTAFNVSGSNVTGYVGDATHATIANIANTVSGANVTGQVANANYALFANYAAFANVANKANTVAGANVTGQVANANYSLFSNVANKANSVAVANVTGIGNIATINLTGSTSNVLYGNGTFAPIPTISNVANSNYANFAGTAFNVSGSNVTGSVNLANFATTANSVAGANVSGQVANALVAGTVTSSAQPNITSLGTLNGLTSNANITAPYFLGNVVGNISGNIVVPGLQWNILYNDAGNAGASNNFLFDANTNIATVVGNVNANYFIGNTNGSSVIGQVSNALIAETVTSSAQPNITSTGTLTSLSVTGNVNASNFIGNAHLVTGLSLGNSNFTDVLISSPTNQQVLQYNGVEWVNNTLNIPSSAGSGVSFWFTSPIIVPTGSNNFSQIDTLNNIPNTSPIQFSSATINGTTEPVMGVLSLPLGRTQFDAGNWDLSIWANANTGATSTVTPCVYQVNPGNGNTITITGTGTSRTATASAGTPFLNSVGSASATAASYLQTSQGIFQITAKTSSTVVTIKTLSTYVNETAVSFFVWDLFYSLPARGITATLSEYLFSTTTNSLVVNTTTRLGIIIVGTTVNNRTIYISYNDTNQSSHILTPFVTLHDNLAGLQGGQTNEYYHLTNTEYTGTGSGVFARQTNAQLVNPNIDSATGTSLSLTGNISANVYTGNGHGLTDLTGANITGTVANATHAITADTAYNVSGSNVSGQVSFAAVANSVAGANVSGTVANASYSVIAGTAYNVSAGNISGTVNLANFATVANSVAGSNVSGTVANATFATTAGSATTADTVTTNAQPNITSTGTLTSLSVTGNITSGNANLGNLVVGNYFSGNGSLLTGIVTSTSTISNGNSNVNIATANGNVTISAGGNTTMTVTDTGINVTGTLNTTSSITGTTIGAISFVSNAATGFAPLQVTSTTRVANLNVARAGNADVATGANLANFAYQAIDATQANITRVGTLTTLSVSGNITASRLISNIATGTAPFTVTSTTQVANLNVATAGTATTATSATTAGTVTTAAQPNITSTGTLTSLDVSGTITGSTLVSNVATGTAPFTVTSTTQVANLNVATAGTATSATTAGTVTTAAQPNITSTGTLTSLSVTGNISGGNISTVGLGNIANIQLKIFEETVLASVNTSTSISPDVSTGTIFRYTANSNFTFNGLTNAVAGSSATIIITQGSPGSFVLSSTMKFSGGSKTLSTATSAIDIISVFYDGTTYYAVLSKGYA